MKIVFVGTSEFAVSILKSIKSETDWEIGLVVCEPAKPAGRSNKITDSPVALEAKKLGARVYAPESISDPKAPEIISKIGADVFVVAAYGQIIPQSVFDIPKYKTVNIHPSLLPKLRGPSPIQAALLNGLKETGVSLMLIDRKMDRGAVLSQKTFAISDSDNYQTLESKLSALGSEMLIRDLPKYIGGGIKPAPQDESEATYTRLIKREYGRADWNKSAREIYNQWRAFSKWPGLFTFFKNRNGQNVRLKLIDISCHSLTQCHSRGSGNLDLDSHFHGNDMEPGTIAVDEQKNLLIVCGDGAIQIKKLQPENSKTQTAAEFLNGYGYVIGQLLR